MILDLFDTNADDPSNLGFIGFSAGSVLGMDPKAESRRPARVRRLFESDSGSTSSMRWPTVAVPRATRNTGAVHLYAGTSPTIDDWRVVITPVPGPGPRLAALAGVMPRRRR